MTQFPDTLYWKFLNYHLYILLLDENDYKIREQNRTERQIRGVNIPRRKEADEETKETVQGPEEERMVFVVRLV